MTKSLFAIILLFVSTVPSAFAGSAQTQLKCTSPTGYTVEGFVPGDALDFKVTVAFGPKTIEFKDLINQQSLARESNANITVVESLKNAVFTLSSKAQDGSFNTIELFALPKSVKYTVLRFGFESKFRAKLRLYSEEFSTQLISVVMVCTAVSDAS
jgi:hypothetical protein